MATNDIDKYLDKLTDADRAEIEVASRALDIATMIDLRRQLAAERKLTESVLKAWCKVRGPDYNGDEDWDRLTIALEQLAAAHVQESPDAR